MTAEREKRPIDDWNGVRVHPGELRNLKLELGETHTGHAVTIPIQVRRGTEDGPVLFVTGAMHGDELNGTGAIRQFIHETDVQLRRGTIILVPVANIIAFERHSRYLPDRRDLNRHFPGSRDGSVASRLAHTIFHEVVDRSNFGIDLHTAAVRRTNFPNVRADLSHPGVRRLVDAFAAEFTLDGVGPPGSLRREATRRGCPTIVFEAGEVWKVEPSITAYALQRLKNALAALGMADARTPPRSTGVSIRKTKWIRAERGGFLRFHVAPGQFVRKGVPVATNTNLLGEEQNVLVAPFNGIVLGMTTLPAVSPGEPVCHLGQVTTAQLEANEARVAGSRHPLRQVSSDLASNVLVVKHYPRQE